MLKKGNICKLKGKDVEPVDVVMGGSPCQNISSSGNGRGLDGDESRLFFEQMRLICEMREVWNAPRFMVWENVANIFACNMGCDFRSVLAETVKIVDRTAGVAFLAGGVPGDGWKKAGALIGPSWSVAWRLTNARYFGVPQSRRRIAVVADFDGATAPDILFGTKPLEGRPARPVMFNRFTGKEWEDAADEVMRHSGYGDGPEVPVEVRIVDYLEPYAGRETYLTVKACKWILNSAEKRNKTIDQNLKAGIEGNIIFDPRQNGLPEGNPVIVETLRVSRYAEYTPGTYSGALRASGADFGVGSECLVVIRFEKDGVVPIYLVRHLSITECERIQGFPDGWTDIGAWTSPKGKVYLETPLSLRGKAIGNSFALPQWRDILRGIYEKSKEKTMASLFDGIGGAPFIWKELGGKTVWNSEIETFPSEVTRIRFGGNLHTDLEL